MNRCPCGYYGDPLKPCTCSPGVVARYQRRLSGPLLDRIDMFLEAPRVEYEKLADERSGESSEAVRYRVQAARQRQRRRFQGTALACNTDMTAVEMRDLCPVTPQAQALLQAAMKQFHLSARAFHRTLKLALTIADLAAEDTIGVAHLAEALQYRPRGMG